MDYARATKQNQNGTRQAQNETREKQEILRRPARQVSYAPRAASLFGYEWDDAIADWYWA